MLIQNEENLEMFTLFFVLRYTAYSVMHPNAIISMIEVYDVNKRQVVSSAGFTFEPFLAIVFLLLGMCTNFSFIFLLVAELIDYVFVAYFTY